MTIFDELLAAADTVVDRIYGENFSFSPMREVINGIPGEDPLRDTIAALTAVFDDQGITLTVAAQAGPERASSGPEISVLELYLPQGVKRLDRFTRTRDGKTYEVTKVDPDGLGRIILTVVERP